MLDAKDNDSNIAGQHQEPTGAHESQIDYYSAAREAKRAGDNVLAMHLYMTAYEEACKRSPIPDMKAVGALREAWDVACELRERSMAEYIFDKLEPHLSSDEIQEYAKRLQDLALDKLSEFGISRTDLEDMADLISEEIGSHAHISAIVPSASELPVIGAGSHDVNAVSSKDTSVGSTEDSDNQPIQEGLAREGGLESVLSGKAESKSKSDASSPAQSPQRRGMTFDDLVGFDSIIEDARALGIGVKQDEDYLRFIETLRAQHGLDKLSASGSVVFRTSSREDASLFMDAIVGELGLPAMKVQMQPGPQGMPVLCVTVSANHQPRMTGRMSLDAPGVLVLEDIDLWGAPLIEAASASEGEGILFANMARAAREAVTLIGTAVANPDIYVLTSMAGDVADQGYLYDLMEPMNIIDIYLPDETERRQVWDRMAYDHPSIRRLDIHKLTCLSRNLSRSDIVSAAHDAVEDAYRQSLKARHYVPLTQAMMYEHISNFQPLESDEYHALEDAVIADFRAQLDRIEAEGGFIDRENSRAGDD